MRGEGIARGGVTLGGLILAATSSDLIGLLFAVELVRIGTVLKGRTQKHAVDWLPVPLLGLGAAGCLAVTGSLELNEIRDVLAAAYSPPDPLTPLGRPARVLIASGGGWMVAAGLPVGVRGVGTADESADEPMEQQSAALTARGLVALLVLSRTITSGWPGLEPVIVTLLVMLSLIGGGFTIWLLRDRQRLDRLAAGFVVWLLAGQLLWLTAAVPSTATAPIARWLPIGWMHDFLVLAAISAATQGWVGRSSSVAYLQELRGMAAIRPGVAALVLVPLASFLGGPLSAGGWLRLTMMAQLFTLHDPGPNDLQWPRFDVRYAIVTWAVVWIVAGRAAAEISRVVMLETPLRGDAPRRSWWPMAVAVVSTVSLIACGCWPQLLRSLTGH
jgi:hypothetical protein